MAVSRRLIVAFVAGCVITAAGFFGATQVIGGNGAAPLPVINATATPHLYDGGPLGTVVVVPARPLPATPRTLIILTPVIHPTIPYPGNGGGPTLCNDGSISNSSGRGTCSHHGGEAH